MGMAASQVRLLTLQNRKSTIGLRLGMLSQREMALANQMDKVSTEYTNALENKTLQWTVSTGKYVDITYDRIMTPMANINQCNPHVLTNREGKVVLNNDYYSVVHDHPEIFNSDASPRPSVMPAVQDYITNFVGGQLNASGTAFTINDVTERYDREAYIHELISYLSSISSSIGDADIKDDINLIVKNYQNDYAAVNSITPNYSSSDIEDHSALYYKADNAHTSELDETGTYYTKVRNFIENDEGVKSLKSLIDMPGFEAYSEDDIEQSIQNAVNYFSNKENVTAPPITNASVSELADVVTNFTGTYVSSYIGGQDLDRRIYDAGFAYRRFYDFVLADLCGYSRPSSADGNTATTIRVVNEDPGTVTLPSIEDMAMNILTVVKRYAQINPDITNQVTYSNALDWLRNGFFNINTKKTAILNNYLEKYLNGTGDESVNSTIESLYNSIVSSEDFDDSYLAECHDYDGKVYDRNPVSNVLEYWSGVTQDEIDFYKTIFERIRDDGYVHSEHGTDKDYLNLMLQNNMYLLDGLYANSCPKIAAVCANPTQQEEALSKYEAEMARINEKEEDIELEIESLNTEYTMIKTEISSVKKIIDDNIKSTFNING